MERKLCVESSSSSAQKVFRTRATASKFFLDCGLGIVQKLRHDLLSNSKIIFKRLGFETMKNIIHFSLDITCELPQHPKYSIHKHDNHKNNFVNCQSAFLVEVRIQKNIERSESNFQFAWEFYFGKFNFHPKLFLFSALDELNFNIWSSGLNIWCLNQALVHFVKLQWTLFSGCCSCCWCSWNHEREREIYGCLCTAAYGVTRRTFIPDLWRPRDEWLNLTLNRTVARSIENVYRRWMCYKREASGEINCTVSFEWKKFHKNRPSIDMPFVIKFDGLFMG